MRCKNAKMKNIPWKFPDNNWKKMVVGCFSLNSLTALIPLLILHQRLPSLSALLFTPLDHYKANSYHSHSQVLGWLKSLFRFFCAIFWKNPNKLFGQSSVSQFHPPSQLLHLLELLSEQMSLSQLCLYPQATPLPPRHKSISQEYTTVISPSAQASCLSLFVVVH